MRLLMSILTRKLISKFCKIQNNSLFENILLWNFYKRKSKSLYVLKYFIATTKWLLKFVKLKMIFFLKTFCFEISINEYLNHCSKTFHFKEIQTIVTCSRNTLFQAFERDKLMVSKLLLVLLIFYCFHPCWSSFSISF